MGVGTPGDRIVRELEQLPHRDRANVVVEVMQRLGMTTEARPELMGRTAKMWATAGVLALALGAGVLVANAVIDRPPPQAWLDLTTTPDDALVFIDGRQVGEPLGPWIHRTAGAHTLTVTRPGYIPSDQNIQLSVNRPLHRHVKLEVAPANALDITSEPDRTLELHGIVGR